VQLLEGQSEGKFGGQTEGLSKSELVTKLGDLKEVFQQWRKSGGKLDDSTVQLLGVRTDSDPSMTAHGSLDPINKKF
jgi:hypothetical protein